MRTSNDQEVLHAELGLTWHLLALAPILILLPIVIQRLDLPFIGNTYGPRHVVFELFGFVIAVSVTIYALMQFKRRNWRDVQSVLPILAFTLFTLYIAVQITEYHPKSTDWLGYEHVGRDLLEGRDPYTRDGFLYPPLFAQLIANAFRIVSFVGKLLAMPQDEEVVWNGVFYLHQCMQFFLIIGAYVLSYRFVRSLGWSALHTCILLIVLFVINTPLLRTVRHHQVNLWLLDSVLVALAFVNSRQWLSGAALAFAVHIKLYPAALLLPLIMMRQFRVVAWFALSVILIVFLQTGAGTDFALWQSFLGSLWSFPQGTAFRDNSIHSVIFNTLRMFNAVARVDSATILLVANVLAWIARVAVVIWFLMRISKRKRLSGTALANEQYAGMMVEGFALALLLSPLVWEHHYVLAMPTALWAAAVYGKQMPWQMGIAMFMMFAIPVFDVFPFSYHRLAGLIVLLHATQPTDTPPTKQLVL